MGTRERRAVCQSCWEGGGLVAHYECQRETFQLAAEVADWNSQWGEMEKFNRLEWRARRALRLAKRMAPERFGGWGL